MVHLFRKKQTIEMLDTVARINGWEIRPTKFFRTYIRGQQKVDILKVQSGFKVVVSKNNIVWDADIVPNKEQAFILAGETMQYRVW